MVREKESSRTKEEEKPAKECAMCLKSVGMEPVPEETARLAHIVCRPDTLCLLMRDELGVHRRS